MKEKSFQFRSSWYEATTQLSGSSQGVAYSLTMGYALKGLELDLATVSALVQGVFSVVREQIDVDAHRQVEISSIRKTRGKLGGRPRKSEQGVKASITTPNRGVMNRSILDGGQKLNNQKVYLASSSPKAGEKQKVYLLSEDTQVANVEQSTANPLSSSSITQEEKAKGFASFPPSSPFSFSPATPNSTPPIIPQSRHLRFVQMTQPQPRTHEVKFLGVDDGQLNLMDVLPHKGLRKQEALVFVDYLNGKLATKQVNIPALRSL